MRASGNLHAPSSAALTDQCCDASGGFLGGRGHETSRARSANPTGTSLGWPCCGLLVRGPPQLPTLLQPDASALRTVCFQAQFAQPASASNNANGTRYLM